VGINAELREQFRLALSYREKAQKLQQESARAWSAGKIDNASYERLSRFYADHIRLAEKEIARCRDEAGARHDQLRSVHNQLARDYQRVRQEEETRRIAPERAARERARLEHEIAGHREALTELQQMTAAKTSLALGGHLDLPIEAYRGEPGAPLASKRRGWRWTWEAVVLALALILIGFAVILALPLFTDSDWSLWGRRPAALACEFSIDPAQGKSLQVECRNIGDRPIDLYLPWPAALPPGLKQPDRSVGGLELQLRELGTNSFETYPVPSEWWLYNGRPLNAGEPVVVEPLLTVQLHLDLTMVKSIGQGIDAMRVIAQRGDGEVFDTYETTFSAQPTSPFASGRPGSETHRPEMPAAAPAPAPTLPPAGPDMPESPAAPETIAPPSPEEPPAPKIFAQVSFLGSVGGKAALSIQLDAESRPRRTMVEVGDDIGGGWLVDAIERGAGQAVVLLHPATGRTVRVVQGAGETALTETAE
jgi:hypothetical protein